MIIPTNAADQVLNFSLDTKGMFQPDIEEPSRYDDFVAMIVCRDPGDELAKADLIEIASYVGDDGIPSRTIDRYVDQMVSEGRLEKAQWGRYRLPLRQ
jgi:hypothetical protein